MHNNLIVSIQRDPSTLTGSLLIAGPSLGDPNFDRTIVFILEHGPQGALGVILNRPSGIRLGESFPAWSDLAGPPAVVFSGGPVESSVAIGLARSTTAVDGIGWLSVGGEIGTVDLSMEPSAISPTLVTMRMYVGYSGWGADQLDQEVAMGAWFVVHPTVDDLFAQFPDQLWGSIMNREETRLAMAAQNPSWN